MLYTDALRPPSGYRFDHGLATTYSLGLDTLLTVPLHLMLYSADRPKEELLQNGVALLDALRRTASRLSVYVQDGRILSPSVPRRLFSLLEPVVRSVRLPETGASFHPKLWVLRFAPPKSDDAPVLRIVVLTRNLTADLSWDLALQLQGKPGDRPRPENEPLARLLETLPELVVREESELDDQELADEVRRTQWSVPEGFDSVRFQVSGLDGGWRPADSDRLLVVSPFCSGGALDELAKSTRDPVALVSRPEELDRLSQERLEGFGRLYTLRETVETGDTDDREEGEHDTRGLHAKLYLTESGERTRLYVGSANATNAALTSGRNLEVMAELEGARASVGGMDQALDPDDGFLAILEPYDPPEEPSEPDPDLEAAEKALETARRELARADLELSCRSEEDGRWRLSLQSSDSLSLEDIASARAWPAAVAPELAVDLTPLRTGRAVALAPVALDSLGRFVAFELEADAADRRVSFVLSLPARGLPWEQRDAAVVRGVIRDQDSFLRYLLFLLGDQDPEMPGSDELGPGRWVDGADAESLEEFPLLEELTRVFCRDPGRLREVRDLLRDLREAGKEMGRDVVPPGFEDLWETFECALEAEGESHVLDEVSKARLESQDS